MRVVSDEIVDGLLARKQVTRIHSVTESLHGLPVGRPGTITNLPPMLTLLV